MNDHARWLGPFAASEWRRRVAALPPADGTTCVVAGRLCAEVDLDAAAARLRSTVPPGGRLVFLEHVGAAAFPRLRGLAASAFARTPGGCHAGRDVPGALRRAGFRITDLERFSLPSAVPLLRPWVRGVAS